MQSWTMEQFIRWSANLEVSSEPHVVLASIEDRTVQTTPAAGQKALRAFRKMSRASRLARVRKVLATTFVPPINVQTISVEPNFRIEVARDRLEQSLREVFDGVSANFPELVDSVNGMIEAVLDEKLLKYLSPPASQAERTHVANSSRGRFKWAMHVPGIMLCMSGPLRIGHVEVVGNGLFSAKFGAPPNLEPIPGRHPLKVAQQRVEEAFLALLEG